MSHFVLVAFDIQLWEALKKNGIFWEYFLHKGGGVSIPKLYVKFWWPFFLAMEFTLLYLNLGKIQILIPKSTEGV